MSDENGDGFGRPPNSGRFRSAQSGNPKGRPRGSRNLKTDLASMMKKRVAIREDGEQRFVSRQQILLLKLFERAAKGDTRASAQLLNMIMKFESKEPPDGGSTRLTENDHEIIEDFFRRRSIQDREDN
jgi:hypothetical protein